MTALVTCPRAERVSAVPTARPHRPPWRSLPALPELWTAGPAEPRGLRPGGQAPFQWDVPLSSRDVARGGQERGDEGHSTHRQPLGTGGRSRGPTSAFPGRA